MAASRSFPTFLLFCVLLVYNGNLRLGYSGDTLPARFLPFSLLLERTFYLDTWAKPYLFGAYKEGAHFLVRARGHWMSAYPVATPVVVTPLYVLAAVWVLRHPPAQRHAAAAVAAATMEKFSASLLAALSAVVLFLAFRKLAPPGVALAVTLIYALASSTWSIASQALWTHALTQLSFALLILALLGDEGDRRSALLAGIALAAAVANRPANALMVIPVLIFYALRRRRDLLLLLAPLVIAGILVLAYNLYFFGTPLGASSDAKRVAGRFDVFRNSSWAGLPGLLMSPSRGLFIFMPWTLLALGGAVRLWKDRGLPWARYLLAGVAVLFVLYSRYDRWWGGYCFGPRYLTDLMPLLALCLLCAWPAIFSRRALRAALVAFVGVALWVQVVGAHFYTWEWDNDPDAGSVDARPQRIFDWTDTQISRNWVNGPAPQDLYVRWWNYVHDGSCGRKRSTL